MNIRHLAVVILMVALGCAPTDPLGPTATPADFLEGEASIDSIEIIILESFPVQVRVVAKGNLPDSCTKLGEASATREGNTFHIRLATERPTHALCTQVLAPFEEPIPLDVVGLLQGDYTVDVNGVTETFQLVVDNSGLGTAYPASGESEEITWAEAETLILDGEVIQVVQFHSLRVTLTLNDGRQVATTEPAIDEVFRVIETCGDPCANLVIATE